MTTATLRCARCEQPMDPGQEVAVDVEQGTSASPTLVVHRSLADCRPANAGRAMVRRYQ
jgi:hypothetical protein